jgi:hypothetical protein
MRQFSHFLYLLTTLLDYSWKGNFFQSTQCYFKSRLISEYFVFVVYMMLHQFPQLTCLCVDFVDCMMNMKRQSFTEMYIFFRNSLSILSNRRALCPLITQLRKTKNFFSLLTQFSTSECFFLSIFFHIQVLIFFQVLFFCEIKISHNHNWNKSTFTRWYLIQ